MCLTGLDELVDAGGWFVLESGGLCAVLIYVVHLTAKL